MFRGASVSVGVLGPLALNPNSGKHMGHQHCVRFWAALGHAHAFWVAENLLLPKLQSNRV